MLVLKPSNCKMLVRIANREDPDQTAFSEAVWLGYCMFVLAIGVYLRTSTIMFLQYDTDTDMCILVTYLLMSA